MKRNISSNNHHIENLVSIGMIGATALSGALLTLPSVLADDSAVTDVAITVPVACSITSTLDSAHTASVDSGTYKDNIGKTTIKTTCNDSQGFSIYAIGYTNEEYGNTVLKPSTLDSPQNDIATGIATNGDTTNTAGKTAIAAFRSFPNNFLHSGYFYASSAGIRGSYGYYWSSTANGISNSYYLSLNSSRVSAGTGNNYKRYGFSIRCVSSS